MEHIILTLPFPSGYLILSQDGDTTKLVIACGATPVGDSAIPASIVGVALDLENLQALHGGIIDAIDKAERHVREREEDDIPPF